MAAVADRLTQLGRTGVSAGQPETGEDGAGPDGAPVSSHAGTLGPAGPAAWNEQHLPLGGDLLLAETQRETMEDKTKPKKRQMA